ncbi:hypothetical protein EVAR_20326_1 [Eumeta japonica]|uniref:Uncharacterized protein n=1 Tax=Eumeta variegata TaxID=151549 RepID=A0A4C1VS72_EUMVA|nr:hypothetical protein EVAR_20326_1 [Eumeta japonica]
MRRGAGRSRTVKIVERAVQRPIRMGLESGLPRLVRYHTLTQYRREVTAPVDVFHPISESFDGQPPFFYPTPQSRHTPSIVPLTLHQISNLYARSQQRTGGSSGVASVMHGVLCGESQHTNHHNKQDVPPRSSDEDKAIEIPGLKRARILRPLAVTPRSIRF